MISKALYSGLLSGRQERTYFRRIELAFVGWLLCFVGFNTNQTRADAFPAQEWNLVVILEKGEAIDQASVDKAKAAVTKLKDFMSRARFTPEGHRLHTQKLEGLEYLAAKYEESFRPTVPLAAISLNGKLIPKVNGTAGCNRWMASASVSETKFEIESAAIALTRKMCPDQKIMAMERKFVSLLGKIRSWEMAGDLLVLETADKNAKLVFTLPLENKASNTP